MTYAVILHEDAREQLLKLDSSIRERIIKHLARMQDKPPGKHLHHGLAYFVEKVGQYRIAFKVAETVKTVYFIGDHPDYEKWLKEQARI